MIDKFDPFKNEFDVISIAEKELQANSAGPSLFKWLLDHYKKLLKTTRRIVSISDRFELQLKKAHEKIEAQQKCLEQAHEELKEKNKILVENVKLREHVDRITRHDLKNPLSAVINYPKLIQGDNLTQKQSQQLGKISAAGFKLLNMINLSLDLYKMEQGIYHLHPEPVNIIEVIDDIVQENSAFLTSKRAAIVIRKHGVSLPETSRFEVYGEKLLIYSMLANLIKNALEATPKKENIFVDLAGSPDKAVAIHNKGVVPQEIRKAFFDKYITSGKKTGTGLGTYSAKLIMDTLGGTISLASSEEEGTVITLTFMKDGKVAKKM